MGNESSSSKVQNNYLSAEDVKRLRDGFPDSGNGSPSSIKWKPWTDLWPIEFLERLDTYLSKGKGTISFSEYQETAGNVVRGNDENRIKFLYGLLNLTIDAKIRASVVLEVVTDVIIATCRAIGGTPEYLDEENEVSARLGQSLIHDLVFSDSRKNSLYNTPEDDVELSFETLQNWLQNSSPLFQSLFPFSLARSFGLSFLSPLQFPEGLHIGINTDLSIQETLFLNFNLPSSLQVKWKLLFNSRAHGESFSKLLGSLLSTNSPSLIILWEDGKGDNGPGNILGAFASVSMTLGPKFIGDSSSFLFNLKPRMYIYSSIPSSTHYQYMNNNQKTLPNGIGFGGQLEYFGLWIDSEYGKARCAPFCSTYDSPQMSKEEYFHYSHCEIWALGSTEYNDRIESRNSSSILDSDPAMNSLMEMMGVNTFSKELREKDNEGS